MQYISLTLVPVPNFKSKLKVYVHNLCKYLPVFWTLETESWKVTLELLGVNKRKTKSQSFIKEYAYITEEKVFMNSVILKTMF